MAEKATADNPLASWLSVWKSVRILRNAFDEQCICIHDVYSAAERFLKTHPSVPVEYKVALGRIPPEFYALHKNLFSTLFLSVYHLLGIRPDRRLLYGRMNHLFRIWVTSADNLLDAEDKMVMPLRMTGSSHVMTQVVAIMVADRVLTRVLRDEVTAGRLTEAESDILLEQTMNVLLPSAAQEASEEGGITERPPPDYVLSVIHRYKTGLLFHIPMVGPESIETDVHPEQMRVIKNALLDFGIGCQVLDDIRDMARDHCEKRHNYVLSTLRHENSPWLDELADRDIVPGDRIYREVLPTVVPIARRGLGLMRRGLTALGASGLEFPESQAKAMAVSMFRVLDLEDLSYA